MRIKIIAVGSTRWQRFLRRWGVSFLIDADVLFDAFGHPAVFARNVRRYGVDLAAVRHVVISHDDWDHIAGLELVLEHCRDAAVYVCPATGPEFKARIASCGARLVEVAPFLQIKEGIFTTGELAGRSKDKDVYEQSLVVKGPQGLVVVAGCAHPGIVPIVARVKERFRQDVRLLIGGLHLKSAPPDEIARTVAALRSLGVEEVAPMHCTGRRAVRAFAQAFGDRCLRLRPGDTLPLPK